MCGWVGGGGGIVYNIYILCVCVYLISLQQICFDSASVPATLIINNTILRTCFLVWFVGFSLRGWIYIKKVPRHSLR